MLHDEMEDEDLVTRVAHCRVYFVDGLRLDLPVKEYGPLSRELNNFHHGDVPAAKVLEVTTTGGVKAMVVLEHITSLVEMTQEYTDKVNAIHDREKKGF